MVGLPFGPPRGQQWSERWTGEDISRPVGPISMKTENTYIGTSKIDWMGYIFVGPTLHRARSGPRGGPERKVPK